MEFYALQHVASSNSSTRERNQILAGCSGGPVAVAAAAPPASGTKEAMLAPGTYPAAEAGCGVVDEPVVTSGPQQV